MTVLKKDAVLLKSDTIIPQQFQKEKQYMFEQIMSKLSFMIILAMVTMLVSGDLTPVYAQESSFVDVGTEVQTGQPGEEGTRLSQEEMEKIREDMKKLNQSIEASQQAVVAQDAANQAKKAKNVGKLLKSIPNN